MKLIKKLPNSIIVPKQLLKHLGINVSDFSLSNQLQDHPDFPSVMAVSDCFAEWNVSSKAYYIGKDEYLAEDLFFPFIAHTQANGGLFMLVHQINNGKVVYSDENHLNKEITEEEFLKRWSGYALHAEATPQSGEIGYFGKQLRGKLATLSVPLLVLSLLLAIFLGLSTQSLTIGYGLLLLFKIVGVATSVLLLLHSIDANNPLLQNLCSLGEKNNCNAILKSDAAKVTPWLSWSEVGFFYFTGSLLSVIFIPQSLNFLVWLNLFSLPYTIWSIYYQYIQKNWCVLCCTVQAVLWLEFIAVLLFIPNAFQLNYLFFGPSQLVGIVLCFVMPVLAWYMLKAMLQKATEHRLLKNQLKKFKYNSELFSHALVSQPRYAIPNDLMPVTLGNTEATTVITMVSNPFCGPCAKAHKTLEDWLKTREDIQLKIVFTTANHDDDHKTKVARHIAALNQRNDTAFVEKALNAWYALREKKYEVWEKDYPVTITDEICKVTQKQKEWCDMAEIAFTPTILVNGYKLPEPYRLDDLKYLIN
jgi:uncharacterized membrane protein